MERVKALDLYLLLDVEPDADEKVIKKAYRKKALTCHPDKNPDNKEAIALFHQLSDALEVLTDEASRRAYDNVLKARKANELRNRQLDGKRRKLKDDLEQRERASKLADEYAKKTDEEKLMQEIERLRKEGSRQLEAEQALMKQQLAKDAAAAMNTTNKSSTSTVAGRLKVKWSPTTSEASYNRDSLEKIFNKYGTVTGVVVNQKKGGSALIEFEDRASAKMAAKIETGFFNCPLKVKTLFEDIDNGGPPPQAETQKKAVLDTDYESLVIRKLRQEEERKRLIAEMLAEDASTDT